MFSPSRIINNNMLNKIRSFSTGEKLFDSSIKSNNTLPTPNLLEIGLKYVTSVFLAPLGICVVKPNHIISYYTFGKYDGYRTSGLRWIPPISNRHETFCGDITLTHTNMHLTDLSSNPIRASSFVIYNITNPVHNKINLDSQDVLSNWIENITRQVISTYSYSELTDSANKEIFNEQNDWKN